MYIDPPYNTESSLTDGNNLSEKDEVSSSKFIYRDKFSRTGWLNMLNERLRLSHQLLKEDGVIFVSIDDSEHAYLKVLMDEIFGEENFVCNIVWQRKNTGGGSGKAGIDVETEYILIYSKNINKVNWNKKDIDSSKYTLKDQYFNERGHYKLEELDRVCSKSTFQYIKSLDYPIKAPDGQIFINHRNIENPESYRYIVGKDLFDFLNQNGFIEFKQIKKGNNIFWKASRKKYEHVYVDPKLKPYIIQKRLKGNNFSNIYNESTTTKGKQIVISILENKDFSFPKPVDLIKFLINLHPNKETRVLDFYAGSGTTGHAVMELNKEDGGNRNYTLVTNNENNIATNVCYERLYRINNGISTNNESNFDWIKKNEPYKSNLNVYNIEYYSTKLFDDNQSNMSIKNQYIKMLQDFGINTENKDSNIDILRSLTSLKPISKEDTDAIKQYTKQSR
ncbi:site-specific DNA-methyltransferase [Mycoplasmopsis agalactiae]|nr:site-specific DNA-methyltransferase [Mycoplasmopsis agalactiae]